MEGAGAVGHCRAGGWRWALDECWEGYSSSGEVMPQFGRVVKWLGIVGQVKGLSWWLGCPRYVVEVLLSGRDIV